MCSFEAMEENPSTQVEFWRSTLSASVTTRVVQLQTLINGHFSLSSAKSHKTRLMDKVCVFLVSMHPAKISINRLFSSRCTFPNCRLYSKLKEIRETVPLFVCIPLTLEHVDALSFLLYMRLFPNNEVGMEQQGQGKQQLKGMVDSRVELLNNATYYQSNPVNVSTTTGVFNCFAPLQPSAQQSGFQLAHHLAYLEREQQSQQQLEQNLKAFWASQLEAAQWATDFKNHGVPLARIRKIMKADKDVAMISAEAPIIFARACEMFILELTLRSWHQTTQGNRRTLQKSDVKAAILKHDVLHDVVARNLDVQEIGAQISDGRIPAMGPNDAIPYYHGMPLSNSAQVGTSAVNMPNFVLDPATYAQQPQLYAPQHMWQQESRSHP
ncbi:Transcription factor CBF/NF-Y/archaeal histone domain [Dillenia turbinata]|uniref:Transcription factor CBF/NF-Y/archaeal histone domain n=1 Tax=Dillenia turbinata TaxID=194707 RepID=A0AAN8UIB1_9MAGN